MVRDIPSKQIESSIGPGERSHDTRFVCSDATVGFDVIAKLIAIPIGVSINWKTFKPNGPLLPEMLVGMVHLAELPHSTFRA